MKLDLNDDEIMAALQDGFRDANEQMITKFAQQIDDPKWPWPNETQRNKGEAVGSPRNIVDRGELKGSHVPRSTPNTYAHAWTAKHAMAVHEGVVRKDGSTTPARPWVRQALRENDFSEMFAESARRELEKIK